MNELEQLADRVIGAMKAYVDNRLKSLEASFAEQLEQRVAQIPAGKDGRDGVDGKDGQRGADGKDANVDVDAIVQRVRDLIPTPRDGADGKSITVEDVQPLLDRLVAKAVDAVKPRDGRDGRDGESVSVEAVRLLVDASVKAAVAELPKPKDGIDGKDATVDVDEVVAKLLPLMPKAKDGRDGKDADESAIVAAILKQIPTPKDGRDGVDGKDGAPGRDGVDGKDGADGAPGKDGRDGIDGKAGEPGRDGKDGVAGKDGRDGIDGKSVEVEDVLGALLDRVEQKSATWQLEFERRAGDTLQRVIDATPLPRDGRDGVDGKAGRDGRDGFTLDDVGLELLEDGRTVRFSLKSADRELTREVRLPVPLYRGVFKRGAHVKGDAVTYGGSLWIANRDTDATPGESPDWRLAVKRGENGRNLTAEGLEE